MRREISKHNNKILNPNGENGAAVQKELYDCNCRPCYRRETCKVMPGIGCQVNNVVYKATVTRADTSQVETYTGSTAQTIKGRFNGHMSDIRHPENSGTCLSKYIHKLTGRGTGYTLKWEILKKAPPWNPISNICRLCVLEKHHILFHPEDSSLNQRSEFFTVCRHKEKHLLVKSWTAFFLKNFSTMNTKHFPFHCSRMKKISIQFTNSFLHHILLFSIYM